MKIKFLSFYTRVKVQQGAWILQHKINVSDSIATAHNELALNNCYI